MTPEEASRRWKRRARRLPRIVNESLSEDAGLEEVAASQTPRVTGRLRRGWEFITSPTEGQQLRNRVPYAGWALSPEVRARIVRAVIRQIESIQPAVVRRIKRTR